MMKMMMKIIIIMMMMMMMIILIIIMGTLFLYNVYSLPFVMNCLLHLRNQTYSH